ncbi:Autophagy-related protein 13b [Linum perenne]
MASSHGNTHSESAKMEQVITEFFAKSLHIILESRSPFMSSRNFSGEQTISSSPCSSSSSSSSVRPRDKWFNLALGECPSALENLDLWRQSNLEPLVVDVILVRRGLSRNQSLKDNAYSSDQEELLPGGLVEKIIERWIVQYDTRKPRDSGSGSGSRRSSNVLHSLYKKSILLLRSLYVTARLLPAYKIFRDLNSSGKLRPFTLTHRLSSFAEPFTRREEADMQRFSFTPVETSSGRLCLSVVYHSSVSDASSESSTPMSPQFIPDYVGSPLADPLKRFTSLPVSHGSPSSSPFSRRHSWSYDRYNSGYFPPSPTYSEPPGANAHPRFGPENLPPQPPENSSVYKTNSGYDEYYPSPNFTPSPSPSPPIHMAGNNLWRTESAPVSIPASKLNKCPILPSVSPNDTRSTNPKIDTSTGLLHPGVSVEKLMHKDDNTKTKHSGTTKISTVSTLQFSFSRSSSKSFHDDLDDLDFPCHFDVENDDSTDHGSRPESFDQKGLLGNQLEPGAFPIRKSQDAAVGALVRMLKKAPPLRQELSSSMADYSSQDSKADSSSSSIMSSGLTASKTTADALEELHGYKRMKDFLLSQGG